MADIVELSHDELVDALFTWATNSGERYSQFCELARKGLARTPAARKIGTSFERYTEAAAKDLERDRRKAGEIYLIDNTVLRAAARRLREYYTDHVRETGVINDAA